MSDPLPLSEIYDRLLIASVEWDVKRNDQVSISGSGEIGQAELAEPHWTATINLAKREFFHLKRQAALIRSLRGSQQAFLACDPQSPWPQADPGGVTLGASNVRIRDIGASRAVALLSGLPSGYRLTAGDKMQINYGNPLRYWFGEVSRDAVASAGGNADVSVFPWMPLSLPVNSPVTLVRPACPVVILKDSHRPGATRGFVTEGASFSVIQRRRRT